MLKNSERNCRLTRSVIRKVLYSAQFQVSSPGPGMIPVPQLPKKPNAGAANDAGLNHSETRFGVLIGATQFGRVARPFVDVDMPGVNTNPLSIIVIPENVQPPNAAPTKPVRPRRNGRFQT